MQKNLRKQLSGLGLTQIQEQLVDKAWRKLAIKSENTISFIVCACKLLLKLLQISLSEGNSPASRALYAIVRDLTQQARNDAILQIQIIRIKCFLLSVRHAGLNTTNRVSLKKIRLFLETVELNPFFGLLQEDFYSQLQQLYLEAAKSSLREGYPLQAIKYLKLCFLSIKRQLISLSEFIEGPREEKLKKLLEGKGKTLELSFYLEHAARLNSSEMVSEQIISQIFPNYEHLFNKLGLDFYSEQIISKSQQIADVANEIVSDVSQLKAGISAQDDSQGSRAMPDSRRQRELPLQRGVSQQLIDSIKFIEKLQGQNRLSVASKSTPQRTSIQLPVERTSDTSQTHKLSKFSKKYSEAKAQDMRCSATKESVAAIKDEGIKDGGALQQRQRFSMVSRAQEKARDRLKSLNPLRFSKCDNIDLVSTQAMIKSGIVAFGRKGPQF